MSKVFNKKVIWITGASRGIGASIALKLAKTDAILALSARTLKSFNKLKKELTNYKNVHILPCDVSVPEEVHNVNEKISDKLGNVDILINNAGVAKFKPFNEFTIDDFYEIIYPNLFGNFLCSKFVLPSMLEKKKGMIINIISVAAEKTFTGSALYSASKAGVLAMSRSMREDLRVKGIKVIDILPGATETELWNEKSRDKFGWRMMNPDNLAGVIIDVLKKSLSDNLMIEEVIVRPQLGDLS
ncbi:MAG: SDR family oxidoreductase [Bacteroidetes bacterium]|nr:MAG: SDR family oxidoreductase [Bacteroidota bacterium]